MSKHYLPLISLLILIAFAVGSFAIYKSLNAPATQTPIAQVTPNIVLTNTPTPIPTGQVAATTSALLSLEIISPQAEASVSSSLLSVSGKTASDAAVIVNDKNLSPDLDGLFKTSLRLVPGPNLVVITASSSGTKKVWQTVVTYTAPTPKIDVP